MKLAYPVVTPDCTIPMMAFSCGDFNTHLSLIKSCGYEGVELLIRDPGQINFKEILYHSKKHINQRSDNTTAKNNCNCVRFKFSE